VRVGPPLPGADQNRELPDLDIYEENEVLLMIFTSVKKRIQIRNKTLRVHLLVNVLNLLKIMLLNFHFKYVYP
jgi:hypothetical protein